MIKKNFSNFNITVSKAFGTNSVSNYPMTNELGKRQRKGREVDNGQRLGRGWEAQVEKTVIYIDCLSFEVVKFDSNIKTEPLTERFKLHVLLTHIADALGHVHIDIQASNTQNVASLYPTIRSLMLESQTYSNQKINQKS